MEKGNDIQSTNVQNLDTQLAQSVVPMSGKSAGAEAVDRAFDAVKTFCEKDPKTAKRIAGTVLTGLGIGITISGVVMIGSTF